LYPYTIMVLLPFYIIDKRLRSGYFLPKQNTTLSSPSSRSSSSSSNQEVSCDWDPRVAHAFSSLLVKNAAVGSAAASSDSFIPNSTTVARGASPLPEAKESSPRSSSHHTHGGPCRMTPGQPPRSNYSYSNPNINQRLREFGTNWNKIQMGRALMSKFCFR